MSADMEDEIFTTPIGLELTDNQGNALADFIDRLTFEDIERFAKEPGEAGAMARGLTELRLALEHAGFYPMGNADD